MVCEMVSFFFVGMLTWASQSLDEATKVRLPNAVARWGSCREMVRENILLAADQASCSKSNRTVMVVVMQRRLLVSAGQR